MKIRVVRKSDAEDVGAIDLSKAVIVHYDPILGALELYSAAGLLPAVYSEKLHDFQTIEKAADGSIYYNSKSAQQIVELYGLL